MEMKLNETMKPFYSFHFVNCSFFIKQKDLIKTLEGDTFLANSKAICCIIILICFEKISFFFYTFRTVGRKR